MQDDKLARDLKRLEEARRRTQGRLDKQQERLNDRFDRIQRKLEHTIDNPSDAQQRIIESALELLKTEGLENLTQRKLANTLNMKAPALYWHFKNKEVLVDYMAEAILDKEFHDLQPRSDDEAWQDWLIDHMMRLRKAMLAYNDGARVVAGAHLYPAVTLAKSLEYSLMSLCSEGMDLDKARMITLTATNYTFGYVIEEQAAPTEEEMKNFDFDAFTEAYPLMGESLEGYKFKTRDEDYLRGLRYIIAGAERC